MNTLIIIVALLVTSCVNHLKRPDSPPYWRKDFFMEKDLPAELKGKPIQYIDSVFKAKRLGL